MATGWAGDGAVQDQIDATVKDGISRAQSRLSQGPSLSHCATAEPASPRHARKPCLACAFVSHVRTPKTVKPPRLAGTTGVAVRTVSCAEL